MIACKKCGAQNRDENQYCYACCDYLESGSLSARQQNYIDTASLGSQLKSLAKNVESMERMMEEEEGINARIRKPVKAATISRGKAMAPFLIPGIILCFVSLMCFFVGARSEVKMAGINAIDIGLFYIAVGVVLIGIGFPVSSRRVKNSANATQAKYDADVKEQASLQARLSEIELSKNILVVKIQQLMLFDGRELGIPESYFYSDAIKFFADRIISGRANSLPDALDAYDDHIHRMKLEQAAQEAAEYQRQSAYNLAAMRRQGTVNTALHVANTIRHWN